MTSASRGETRTAEPRRERHPVPRPATVRSGARFAASDNAAGGQCQYELFENCEHEWVATPVLQTDRAQGVVKAFIAHRLMTFLIAGQLRFPGGGSAPVTTRFN